MSKELDISIADYEKQTNKLLRPKGAEFSNDLAKC